MKRIMSVALAAVLVLGLVVALGACQKKVAETAATATTAGTAGTAKAPETPLTLSADAAKLPAGTKVAVIDFGPKGLVEIELLEKETPKTSANFIELVNDKFYDVMPVHRVEDFVLQAGDGTLIGKDVGDRRLDVEKDKRKCLRGAVSMARGADPATKEYRDTSPTQFFILKKDSPHLDPDFCVFGVVVSGMENVDKVEVNDMIERIRILTVGEVGTTAPAPTAVPEKQ